MCNSDETKHTETHHHCSGISDKEIAFQLTSIVFRIADRLPNLPDLPALNSIEEAVRNCYSRFYNMSKKLKS